jgi:DNA-binding response OmpR family regulator
MTFLVVGGAGGLAERVQERLEERGFGCLISRDLEDADWTLQVARVEALVLDLDVDRSASLDWLEGLVLSRPRLAARAVALSQNGLGEHDLARIVAAGVELIRKPVDLDGLSDAILRRAGTGSRGHRPAGPAPSPEDPLPEA